MDKCTCKQNRTDRIIATRADVVMVKRSFVTEEVREDLKHLGKQSRLWEVE